MDRLSAGGAVPVTKVGSPADVVTMIPYMFGFTPTDSLVVQVLLGPRGRFGPSLRVDLVDPEHAGKLAGHLLAVSRLHRFTTVLVVAYSDDPVRADPVMAAVVAAFTADGVEVQEAVRADGRRWWSYLCDNPGCCHPSGTPYDAGSSRMAAEAVFAGLQSAPSRDSLRDLFSPGPADRMAEVARLAATVSAEADVARLVTAALPRAEVLTAEEVATLGVSVQRGAGREAAWAMMSRHQAERHLQLWAAVTRQVPDRWVPAVGSLAGFAAWLKGSGVLASHAADRVRTIDPTFPMALLIGELLDGSINPETWEEFRPHLVRSDYRSGGDGPLG